MPASCGDKTPGFYQRRAPRESPLFQLLEQHFYEFERVYPGRYQERYGFFRPVIRKAVDAFLGCGDLREGFARVGAPIAETTCSWGFPASSAASAQAATKNACWSLPSISQRTWRLLFRIGSSSLPCQNDFVLTSATTGICSNIFPSRLGNGARRLSCRS
jgi:hypothetical protein